MSGRGEPPGGRGVIRRVFDDWFGPAEPGPDATLLSDEDRRLRREFIVEMLAESVARFNHPGFTCGPDDRCHRSAEHLVFVRALVESGRLDDGWANPIWIQTGPRPLVARSARWRPTTLAEAGR